MESNKRDWNWQKTNYLPWILGGVVSLVGTIAWFWTRNNKKGGE